MPYSITLIPGDGVGPEIAECATRAVAATGVKIDWDVQEAGAETLERKGALLPESVLASIRANKVALKGPITTPIGTGFRSVNVALRHELNLYACVRPCKYYPGVRSHYPGTDLVIVRENTEDLYAGVEFAAGSKEAETIRSWAPAKVKADAAISIKPISVGASERIVRYAFEYALANNRRKVTAVAKANIMKLSDGLFYDTARKVAAEYAGRIEYEERLVDNMCMQLVQKPELYDVLVMPNLYGDILSDLCAGLVGGLGMAPGANIGDNVAVFEPTHGSAPKYKGQNKVNPCALILSAALMLKHIGESDAAIRLEQAVQKVLAEGRSVTYDLKEKRDDPGIVGTKEMTDAIIAAL